MKKKIVSNEHNYVLFEEEVKKHFHFLVEDYQFRLSKIERWGFVKSIRFESRDVYVNVHYGPPAYEVEMAFGRIGIDDVAGSHSFSPGDLVLLSNNSDWKESSQTENRISREVEFFARLLRICGEAALHGEKAMFERLAEQRSDTA